MTSDAQLTEIGAGVFAYLQRGGWGVSNAGLIRARQGAMLVDTLYDLRSTRRMLDAMRGVLGDQALDAVVNTHANGDHCWGNAAVGEARIVSSQAAAEEMSDLSPRLMHTLVQASRVIAKLGSAAQGPLRLLGRLGITSASALSDAAEFVVDAFGAFDFGGLSLRLPDQTFQGRLMLDVGDKKVELLADLACAWTARSAPCGHRDRGHVDTGIAVMDGGIGATWTPRSPACGHRDRGPWTAGSAARGH